MVSYENYINLRKEEIIYYKMGKKGLVGKIFWTSNVSKSTESTEKNPLRIQLKKQIFTNCQKLEEAGFGMLEDSNNLGKIDSSCSVVCPDGNIFTPKQITDYFMERKGGYSSKNPEDCKMNEAQNYYLGFKELFSNNLEG